MTNPHHEPPGACADVPELPAGCWGTVEMEGTAVADGTEVGDVSPDPMSRRPRPRPACPPRA